MKTTFMTTMPDRAGAFLRASEILSSLGLNITRVSYNKAIDSHMLFLDAEGEEDALRAAEERLSEIGYLRTGEGKGSVILMEFLLRDVPGSVLPVLRLIEEFRFNISYISSAAREGETHQRFRMGLFVDDSDALSDFIRRASLLCELTIVEYNETEKNLDNTVFYISFANRIAERTGLTAEEKKALIIHSNEVMELLDKSASAPYKTFEYIGTFAEHLNACRGEAFRPRISEYTFDDVNVTLIEPPCGSNIALLRRGEELLVVDTGFASHGEELRCLIRRLCPNVSLGASAAVITHADADHCGLLDDFGTVYMSEPCFRNFAKERAGEDNIRERNPLHAPYIRISKLLSRYSPPEPDGMRIIGGMSEQTTPHFRRIGTISPFGLNFEVYEGAGGHAEGEIVLCERRLRIAFTGDIYVNIKGFTPEQAAFNRLAPYLMTGVDTDPAMAAEERREIPLLLGAGVWHIFGGHGAMMDMKTET